MNVSTKETRLLYMTTGVLLQKIVSARSLTQFTHIFIDEVSCWKFNFHINKAFSSVFYHARKEKCIFKDVLYELSKVTLAEIGL